MGLYLAMGRDPGIPHHLGNPKTMEAMVVMMVAMVASVHGKRQTVSIVRMHGKPSPAGTLVWLELHLPDFLDRANNPRMLIERHMVQEQFQWCLIGGLLPDMEGFCMLGPLSEVHRCFASSQSRCACH